MFEKPPLRQATKRQPALATKTTIKIYRNMKSLKKICITLILIHFYTSTNGQTTKELDNKKGFKIFILGTSIESYKEFYKYAAFPDINGIPSTINGKQFLNIKNTEFNKIGEIPLSNINLEFVDGLLIRVEVQANYEYDEDIYKILKEAYGPPNVGSWKVETDTYAEWAGEVVSLKMEGKGNLSNLSSVRIAFYFKETKKSYENKIKKGAKDL